MYITDKEVESLEKASLRRISKKIAEQSAFPVLLE